MVTADRQGRNWRLLVGDVLERLAELPDDSVHCCVTSPPYWGLRDYGTGRWEGGDPNCDHKPRGASSDPKNPESTARNGKPSAADKAILSGECPCGARRIDRQIGLESTPEEFVARLVDVFRQVRRVMRHDGTLWLNIGDSYAGSWGAQGRDGEMPNRSVVSARQIEAHPKKKSRTGAIPAGAAFKPKDLVGVPWLLAFALRADGWYLRSEIIWHKRSPMPESVRDRPTKAHEQIFLLSKSPTYFYDAEAIKEPATSQPPGNRTHKGKTAYQNGDGKHRTKVGLTECVAVESRNSRSVWTLSTESYAGAHFATFPTTIPARAIKAGTSEIGCCPDCGSPWRRVVEKERIATRPGTASKLLRDGASVDRQTGDLVECPNRPWAANGIEVGNRDPQRHVSVSKTAGWQPSCDCGRSRDEAVPCVVLEPFAGSGTTLRVALELGRAAIGVELNPEYAVLAEERITAPLEKPAERYEPAAGQRQLFEATK